MFRKVKNILSTIFLIFAICILIFVLYEVIQARKSNEELFILGYKPYIILTGSMEPELKVNELVIIKKESYEKIQIGDIINFYAPGVEKTVCHRVIDINDAGMYTKGDNNNREDILTVTQSSYVGKMVFKTSILAFIIRQVYSPYGIIKMIAFIVSIVLAVILGRYLLRTWWKNRNSLQGEPEETVSITDEIVSENTEEAEPVTSEIIYESTEEPEPITEEVVNENTEEYQK